MRYASSMKTRQEPAIPTMVYLPRSVRTALDEMAESSGRSVSNLGAHAIGTWLRHGGEAPAPPPEPEIPFKVRQLAEMILSMPTAAQAKFAEFADLFFANWSERQNDDGTMPSRLGKVQNILLAGLDSEGTRAPDGEDPTRKRRKPA